MVKLIRLALFCAAGVHALVLLNDPVKKAETRLNSLKNLRKRMDGMEMSGLLADQKPHLQQVMKKIDAVLADKKVCSDDKALDHAIKDVQGEIEGLKAALMKKAMELQSEQKKLFKLHSEKKATEEVFDQLMNAQEQPLAQQMSILEGHKDNDFIAKFLKNGKFQEGDNLAMAFGQALDNKVAEDKKEKEQTELQKLEKTAHLSEKQAKNLLPILSRVREQQMDKQAKLREIDDKLQKMEETERFYKKHKAILSKESSVLAQAVDAIEHGKIDRLTKAMKQLKEIGV